MNKTIIILLLFLGLIGSSYAVTYVTTCQVLSGDTYFVLQNDVTTSTTTCFKAGADNIVFDGNGHTVYSTADSPFYTNTYTNFTIKNIVLNVSIFRSQFLSDVGKNLIIDNVTVYDYGDTTSGIQVFSIQGGLIVNNSNIYIINNTLNHVFFLSYNTPSGSTVRVENNNVTIYSGVTASTYYDVFYAAVVDLYLINNTFDIRAPAYMFKSNGNTANLLYAYNNYFIENNSLFASSDYFNTVYLNTTKTSGTNIVGGPYIAGNYWAKQDGTGFSQTCTDANNDGICDDIYERQTFVSSGDVFIDYLPLADTPISVLLTSPANNTTTSSVSLFEWTTSGFSSYECNITIDGTDYYAGANSVNYSAPASANSGGTHYWNVTCWDGASTVTSETWQYTIPQRTITLTNPLNNTITQSVSSFDWSVSNFVGAYYCNITIDGTEYSAVENTTSYSAPASANTEGEHNWSVYCWDSYDTAQSDIYYYKIDTTAPNITSLTLEYTNVTPEHFTVKCYVDEENVNYVEINLTTNDSSNHSGSVNATGNYNVNSNYYYADFFWTKEDGVVYNYSCYVEDAVGLSDYASDQYSTVVSSPGGTTADPWENYTFTNVDITITEPKAQDTIPFKQYYLTFTIQHTFTTPRNAVCKLYISYDLGYTDKHIIFSKNYYLENQTTTIREPINTEVSFLDYVGNYQRDTPSQQKIYIICGLDNYYAGYSESEYYVHSPSILSLVLLLLALVSIITLLWATIYTDKGVLYGYISMTLFLFSVLSLSIDGVAGSWYFKEFIEVSYYLINILFLIAYAELAFEPKEEMKVGL